jgi:hypothetical protein
VGLTVGLLTCLGSAQVNLLDLHQLLCHLCYDFPLESLQRTIRWGVTGVGSQTGVGQ